MSLLTKTNPRTASDARTRNKQAGGPKKTLTEKPLLTAENQASEENQYIQSLDHIPWDSVRGILYIIKCWLAILINSCVYYLYCTFKRLPRKSAKDVRDEQLSRRELREYQYDTEELLAIPYWEPKEPHDKHYREFKRLARILVALAKTRQRTIAVLGSKGGVGKTPLATFLAALVAFLLNGKTLIVDANHNEGTTGKMLGLSRSGRTLLREVIRKPALLATDDQRKDALGEHRGTGLQALMSNSNSIEEKVDIWDFIHMLRDIVLQYRAGFFDGGNGNSHATNNGSAHEADVLLFPALVSKPASFGVAFSTMLGFLDLGHEEKVRHGLKIVSATRRSDTRARFVERYRKLAEEHASHENDPRYGKQEENAIVKRENKWYNKPDELMEALGITEENIFLVPYSSHIRLERTVAINRFEVGFATLLAYLRIAVRIFEMNVPSKEEKRKLTRKVIEENGDEANARERQIVLAYEAEQRYGSLAPRIAARAADMKIPLDVAAQNLLTTAYNDINARSEISRLSVGKEEGEPTP